MSGMPGDTMDVRTRTTLMALRWHTGPEKVMAAFKSQLIAATVAGTAGDLEFLVETAKVLPDPTIAARFLKLLRMMKKTVEEYIATDRVLGSLEARPSLFPGENEVLGRVAAILDETEREAKLGFGAELAEAELAVEVVES